LDTALNNDTDITFLHTLPDDYAAPDLHFNHSDSVYEVTKLLGMLSPREEKVLRMHFGLSGKMPMSLEEIARDYHLSKERIRQIRDRGIKKLRFKTHRKT
jgi:RNA polymerase primary sigma factor